MSPVARRTGNAHTGRAVLVALVGVGLLMGLGYAVVVFSSSSDDVEIRLGDDRFGAGNAEDRSERIAEDDAPIGFGDPLDGTRPIWLDHTGDDPDTGWVAFGAFLPDDPGCTVNWQRDRDEYVADCDDSITFGRDGAGLRQYRVIVEDGDLFVDLRDEDAGEDAE